MDQSLPFKLSAAKPFLGEWLVEKKLIDYPSALKTMEDRVDAIDRGQAEEFYWLLEHPPIYTAGTSSNVKELIDPSHFPVFQTGRGGRYTYHGPGQRVIYALCDLRKRDRDIRQHVCRLEEWVIRTLADFDLKGERRSGRVGIWIEDRGEEKKIAAIGVRVRRWITYHGLSLNVHPDLSHFRGIVPCGLDQFGVTSMHNLGRKVSLHDVDAAFQEHAKELF